MLGCAPYAELKELSWFRDLKLQNEAEVKSFVDGVPLATEVTATASTASSGKKQSSLEHGWVSGATGEVVMGLETMHRHGQVTVKDFKLGTKRTFPQTWSDKDFSECRCLTIVPNIFVVST